MPRSNVSEADAGSGPSARFVADAAGERLDKFVARVLAITRTAAQRLIEQGNAQVNGRPSRSAHPLVVGDLVTTRPLSPRPSGVAPEQVPLSIVYRDDDLLVVDKPADMVVHPGAGRRSGTLANALLGMETELSSAGGSDRPGIVHRLDRETSGLLIVARNDRAHAELARQFAERSIKKTYLALLASAPQPASGLIDAPIARDLSERQRMSVREGGRSARTRYQTLGVWQGRALVAAAPETGRTHQLRVHFAAIGAPVCGDATYGGGQGPAARMWLHAWRLRFRRPSDGETVTLEAPLPVELTIGLPDLAPLLARGREWSLAQTS
jgi:23S rRNA pseudouridine1911/1915/1917 synthase